MVAKVAEGLHYFAPRLGFVGPARVAVELLVVLDEGLNQHTLPRPLPGIVIKRPYSGHVDLDGLVNDVEFVESVDNLEGLIDSFDVEGEVVGLEDGARLEKLGNACLAAARAGSVGSLGYPPERAFGKGAVELGIWYRSARGDVVSAAIKFTGRWDIGRVPVDAARTSRCANALGELVGRIGRPGQVTAAGNTLARSHVCLRKL